MAQSIKSYFIDICVLCSILMFMCFLFYLEAGASSLTIWLGYSLIPESGTALGGGPTG